MANFSPIPSPHKYTYILYTSYQIQKIPKSYLAHLVHQFDITAQGHTNFDEKIPHEGYTIKLDHELVQLDIIQHGDKNLVWGNVKNALVEMKKHFADRRVPSQTDLVEVAVQDGHILEGYVRMVAQVCSLEP